MPKFFFHIFKKKQQQTNKNKSNKNKQVNKKHALKNFLYSRMEPDLANYLSLPKKEILSPMEPD